jgi:hypothetical protein
MMLGVQLDEGAFDGYRTDVVTGTWSIVSGTGRYAHAKGGGPLAGIDVIGPGAGGTGNSWRFSDQFEGYATGF